MLSSPKFKVLSEIGRGGMGTVYRVRHVTLETVLAVKVLNPSLAGDGELAVRFEREAQVMARLAHENIVRVVDIDSHEGVRFIVMEYVEGTSLGELCEESGPLEPDEALAIAAQVASALAYAHGRGGGVIHRDIKPGNIIVEEGTRRAVVTDFGIAKVMGASDLTRTGFMGTLRFSAPEQIRGERVDGRADVYSLGLVLFQMLAGAPPFANLDERQIIARLLAPEERPLDFPAHVPEGLRQVIRRAIALDRERRFPSAASFLEALVALRRSRALRTETPRVDAEAEGPWVLGVANRSPSPDDALDGMAIGTVAPERRALAPRAVWIAALLALLAVAAGGAFWRSRPSRPIATDPLALDRAGSPPAGQPGAAARPSEPTGVTARPSEPAGAAPAPQSGEAEAPRPAHPVLAAPAAPPAPAELADAGKPSAAASAPAPRIENTSPESRKLELKVGEVADFRAEATDGDGRGLSVTWSVDGRPMGTTPTLRYEAPAEKRASSHVITAEAVGSAGTRARATWHVAVAATAEVPPEVQSTPGGIASVPTPPAISHGPLDVEILDLQDSVSTDKRTLTVAGKLKNRGTSPIERLTVIVQALDEGENLVSEESGVPTPQPLPPGDVATFRVSMANSRHVQSFHVLALPRSLPAAGAAEN
jgi:predicted Ser/Thr protein kinase